MHSLHPELTSAMSTMMDRIDAILRKCRRRRIQFAADCVQMGRGRAHHRLSRRFDFEQASHIHHVRQLAGAKRCGDGVLERHHGDVIQGTCHGLAGLRRADSSRLRILPLWVMGKASTTWMACGRL